MASTNPTFQPSHVGIFPLSIWIGILAIFSAVGIVLRQVAIPTFSPYVTLTPGFIIPLLAGIILGPLGGILCGIFVGISGALWEPFLIPLIGNIALGISTGIPTYYRHKLNQLSWNVACILAAVIIGGFLPTFSIEVLIFGLPTTIAAITASVDGIQAGIWIVVAIILAQGVIDPILLRYKREEPSPE
ncbi:MAG: ECF transporter S component [Candidatus Thorarchaeota archaeon]